MPKITDPAALAELNAPSPRVFGAPDPFKVEDQAIQRRNAEIAARSADRQDNSSARSLALQEEKFAFEREQAAKAEAAKSGQLPKTPEAIAAAQDEAMRNIRLAQSLQDSSANDFFATGAGAQLARLISGTKAYDAAANVLTLQGQGALEKIAQIKQESGGANPLGILSNSDLELIKATVANLDTGQTDETFQRNLGVVIDKLSKVLTPEQRQSLGIVSAPPQIERSPKVQTNPNNPQGGIATGATRGEGDPKLDNLIDTLIQSGAPIGQVRAARDQYLVGIGARPVGDADNLPAVYDYKSKNPQYKGGFSQSYKQVDQTLGERAAGIVGDSAVGGLATGALQGVTGGYADELAGGIAALGGGDYAQSRDAFAANQRLVNEANPISSTIGELGGGVASTLGGGLALRGAGKFAPLAADAIYGGIYGSGNAQEGDRLQGGAIGAATGVIGSKIGERLAGGLSSGLAGVQNPAVQTLDAAGVPMTFGQIRGGASKLAEDRRTSNPFIGDLIAKRQRESLAGANRAAFNQFAEPLGGNIDAIGQEGLAQAQRLSGDAFDTALSNPNLGFVPDSQLAQALGSIQRDQASRGVLSDDQLARVAKNVSTNVGGRIRQGGLFGSGFKKAMSGLRKDAQTPDIGQGIKEYQGAFMDAARRQSPPEALEALSRADAAYPMLKALEGAVGAARNQGDGIFTGAQLGNAAFGNTKKFGGSAAAARGDVPFNQLQQAMVEVLPSKAPDSGTAGRTAENLSGLLQQAIMRGKAAAISPLYSETAQPIIQKALTKRSKKMISASRKIKKNQRILGAAATPILLTNQE